MRLYVRRFAIAGSLLATACSGHGGSAPLPIASAPLGAPTNAPMVQVAFRILVPALSTTASSRRPQYVSASTKSASIAVSPGSATPVVVNCTTVCQGEIAAPIGTDTFTVKLYDASGATGNLLSTGTMASTVVIDQNNSINLTFNGVVAAIAVGVNPGTATYGAAESASVTVNALDADGNTIVAPGVYVNANGAPLTIALANSDTSGHTVLSVTHVTQPTTGITLSYDGNSYVSPTITGTATGATSGAGTLTVNCAPAAATPALYTDGFSDTGAQTLDRYALTTSGDNVAPSSSAALNIFSTAYATGLALDASGTLYANGIVQVQASPVAYQIVVDTWCADVTGSPPPRTNFVEPQTGDGEIALDGAANLYYTTFNSSDNSFSIDELAAGSGGLATSITAASTPTPALRSFKATPPILYALYPSLAVDGPGNMYAGADTVISEYAAGSSGSAPAPTRSISTVTGTGLITPLSTAVDPSGNVYVLYLNDMRTAFPGGYAVAEFAAGTVNAPERVIEGPATQIGTYFGNPSGIVNSQAVSIAVDPSDNLFVLNRADMVATPNDIGQGSIQEFPSTASGNVAPETTVNITGSAVNPNDLAVDASDNLYVSDAGSFIAGGSWYEYTASGTHVRTLAGNAPDGTSTYENIAVDSSGNVAVTDYDGATAGAIYFFGTAQTGAATPAREITGIQNVLFVQQLGFDSSANLYMLTSENPFNTVFISSFAFAAAHSAAPGPVAIVARDAVRARPLAIPSATAARRGPQQKRKPQFALPPSEGGPAPPFSMVSVFSSSASGAASPTRTFTDTFAFDSEGDDMKVLPNGTTYVSSRFANAVYEYSSSASGAAVSPVSAYWAFAQSTVFPHIGVDTSGALYVISGVTNSISVYAAGSTTPARTIVGPHTLLSAPGKPVIDSAGNIYVLDFDLNAVLVYGPGQSGDVPPARMLDQSDVAARILNQIAIGPGTVVESTSRVRSRRR
jgi:hypothetical protein